ncbi:MAG: inosine 5-monophosphate dehydrogenase [Planctomycetales bacterium 4484_113]|nr:MAG: inosine 5-monophosphate dehydrogenase [Planctomycetales bacterium 4484_113]
MEFSLSPHRRIRLTLGFDDVSLVPSATTVDPRDVDVSFQLGPHSFKFPIIASAMDGVVSPSFAILLHELGGLGVVNLEGIFTRYEKPQSVLQQIVAASDEESTALLQQIYREPVKPKLIEDVIRQMKDAGALAAGSLTPRATRDMGKVAVDAGLDILVVQSTVTSPRYRTTRGHALSISELTENLEIPLLVGNCVSYEVALEFMHAGIDGVLVGVGPGQACTTRAVTGVGVPQVTATAEVAAARDDFHENTGKYVSVITDGGMRQGGQIAKALAAGADAVMLGSIFAGCPETPAAPYHWGMATPDPSLPRGTRVRVDKQIPARQLLFGPTSATDGTENLVGCIVSSMSLCGAARIREMHEIELVFSLSFLSEGKNLQRGQRLGMGV